MKLKYVVAAGLAALFFSCDTEGVSADPAVKPEKRERGRASDVSDAEKALEPKKAIVAKKEFPSGLKIQWFEKGSGAQLKDGHVYEINFKAKLGNGDVIDGNHLLKRDMIPFLVGFGMQTPGWDMAMKEMQVGDFAEVYIPAHLARGKAGVPGLIPPNSPNILLLRIGKEVPPTRVVDGTKVWRLEEKANDNPHAISEKSRVAFHYFVGAQSNPRYDNSYQRNAPFRFNMSDPGLVPGLKKALINAKLYDKLWILVPADQAYGSKGYHELVKPNETLFYDLFIREVDGAK